MQDSKLKKIKKTTDTPVGPLRADWGFIDAIYCITLSDRPARRQAAEAQFDAFGLSDRVIFVDGLRIPGDSEKGIYLSHIECIGLGIEAGARHIMIFEDDVEFNRIGTRPVLDCEHFITRQSDWDVLFLGCLVTGIRRTEHRYISKVGYRSLAHAYVVRRGFAEKIVRRPWEGIPFDTMLRQMGGRFFAVSPALAFQSALPSENRNRLGLDRARRWLGGLRRIQKMNQWYYRNRAPVIFSHIAAAVFLLVIVWCNLS